MGVTVGLLVLFALGASWASDARELITSSNSDSSVLQINHQESEDEVKASEVVRNDDACTMCKEFAAEAIKYLEENQTQIEIIDTLHKTCSRLIPFEQKCIALVDYYLPLLFQEIGSVQPGDFCQKVKLCEQKPVTSQPPAEDVCDICHLAVAEVLFKLKDPDTQLDILELLLKACDAVESHLKKCKTLVLEYGPQVLDNAEEFLETVDICSVIHACDFPSAGSKKASTVERESMLSVL